MENMKSENQAQSMLNWEFKSLSKEEREKINRELEESREKLEKQQKVIELISRGIRESNRYIMSVLNTEQKQQVDIIKQKYFSLAERVQ